MAQGSTQSSHPRPGEAGTSATGAAWPVCGWLIPGHGVQQGGAGVNAAFPVGTQEARQLPVNALCDWCVHRVIVGRSEVVRNCSGFHTLGDRCAGDSAPWRITPPALRNREGTVVEDPRRETQGAGEPAASSPRSFTGWREEVLGGQASRERGGERGEL